MNIQVISILDESDSSTMLRIRSIFLLMVFICIFGLLEYYRSFSQPCRLWSNRPRVRQPRSAAGRTDSHGREAIQGTRRTDHSDHQGRRRPFSTYTLGPKDCRGFYPAPPVIMKDTKTINIEIIKNEKKFTKYYFLKK